jgi:formylglycine-generating enzyme required for sulfatase activity
MGSETGGLDEKPVHEVCLSDYYIGKYEVTQAEWKKVMGGNPSHFSTCGADCPVESVSWFNSQDFIQKLGALSGRAYRLPTEAEWEYAGRSGGRDEKFVGTNDEAVLDHYAWYEKNSGEMTHRVGQKKANALGIHDMSGNVQEWCHDWYDEAYYSKSPRNNPAGAPAGESRVLRGGSWNFDASLARASSRFWIEPGVMGSLGLRLVFSAK